MYNLSVAREVLKQVYVAERLAPPTSFSTVTSAYQTLWARASNPGYWREILKNGEWQRVGVYAIEAYGIFKVSLYYYCNLISAFFRLFSIASGERSKANASL